MGEYKAIFTINRKIFARQQGAILVQMMIPFLIVLVIWAIQLLIFGNITIQEAKVWPLYIYPANLLQKLDVFFPGKLVHLPSCAQVFDYSFTPHVSSNITTNKGFHDFLFYGPSSYYYGCYGVDQPTWRKGKFTNNYGQNIEYIEQFQREQNIDLDGIFKIIL